MAKILVAYYSRTGTTKKLAENIAKILNADIDEIIDKKSRSGPIGFLTGGRDAMKRKETTIETKKNPEKYDLVVIGTPVWAGNVTPAVRTYLTTYNFKKVAFFCTFGGSSDKTFGEMEKICKRPTSILGLKGRDVQSGKVEWQVKRFCAELLKGRK
jgi:flavodoxin